jgi:hypothetical protein
VRRLLVILLDVMTLLSALLCLAAVGLWLAGWGLFYMFWYGKGLYLLRPAPLRRHNFDFDIDWWYVIVVTALLPVVRRRRFRFRRSRAPGLCPACGYDLRATPDRCPECGKVPAAIPPNAPARSPADRSG